MTLRTTSRPRAVVGLTAVLTATLTAGLLGACGVTQDRTLTDVEVTSSAAAEPTARATAEATAEVAEWSYEGEAGRTALELLLASDPSAVVSGEGENAYVTSIGGRAADDARKEFWALYVDGEQASVGAGSLVTEDGQEVTWKLETY